MMIILINEDNMTQILKRAHFKNDDLIRFITEWAQNRDETDLYLVVNSYREMNEDKNGFDLYFEWNLLTARFVEMCFDFDSEKVKTTFTPFKTKEIVYD